MTLSETFDLVAELYDRARPRYPAELYDALAAGAALGAGSRVLEIAPATGIVSVELARRGYAVTAVEMGASLAAVARRNLAPFPSARVDVSRFEDWALPAEPFDLVCCATAFFWLDRAVRWQKCAAALKPGGFLAIWDTLHVDGGTSQFFADSQECYERLMPGTPKGLRLEPLDQVAPHRHGMDEQTEFEHIATRYFEADYPYTTDEYVDLLHTFSNHIELGVSEPAKAEGLYNCIRALIDTKYGGHIVKHCGFNLMLFRKR